MPSATLPEESPLYAPLLNVLPPARWPGQYEFLEETEGMHDHRLPITGVAVWSMSANAYRTHRVLVLDHRRASRSPHVRQLAEERQHLAGATVL